MHLNHDVAEFPNALRADLVEGFSWHLRGERFADKTVSSLMYGVDRFFRRFDLAPKDVTRRHVQMFMSTPGWADNTARAYAKGVFAFFAYLVGEGVLDSSPADGLKLPKHGPDYTPPRYSEDDVNDLIAACKTLDRIGRPLWIGRRDIALLRVLATTPARLGEIERMLVTDIHWRDERIQLHNTKSDIEYFAWLFPETGAAIQSYINARPVELAALWVSQDGRSTMTAHAIQQMLRRLGRQIGGGKRIHAHAWRHHFGQNAVEEYRLGLDETAFAMGHLNPKSTMRYRQAAVTRSTIDKIRAHVLKSRGAGFHNPAREQLTSSAGRAR
jgi:integrase